MGTAATTSRPILEIEGLTIKLPKGADRANAIEDVSITVGRGEIVCLVGESGSGKSVSAFSVMGLLPSRDMAPVAGSIRLEGEELIGIDEARLRALRGARMSMIFQEPMTALNPTMTCGAPPGHGRCVWSGPPRSGRRRSARSES